MNFTRCIFGAAISGGVVWLMSVFGYYICLFEGSSVFGALTFKIVTLLAWWPLGVFVWMFPLASFSLLTGFCISLIGWMLLAIIAALLFQLLSRCTKQIIRDERPVA